MNESIFSPSKFISSINSNKSPLTTNRSPLTANHLINDNIQPLLNHISISNSNNSNNNIIKTFRELQNKIKILENERLNAIKERDTTKQAINNIRYNIAYEKNKDEIYITDSLLNSRLAVNKTKLSMDELTNQLDINVQANNNINDKIRLNNNLYNQLVNDVDNINKQKKLLKEHIDIIKSEQDIIDFRINNLQHTSLDIPIEISTKFKRLQQSVNLTDKQINDIKQYNKNKQLIIKSLEEYIQLLNNINNDICNILLTRENNKINIFKLANKYSIPRYAWPKTKDQSNYNDLIEVVNDAATNSAIEQMNISKSYNNLHLINSYRNNNNKLKQSRSLSPGKVLEHKAAIVLANSLNKNEYINTKNKIKKDLYRSISPNTLEKKSFIPTSGSKSIEFNKIAKESKMSRKSNIR